MAKIGMEYVCSGKLIEAENGAATYEKAFYWGPSSKFSMTPQSSDVEDWGDDRLCESDKGLTSIDLSIELNEATLATEAYLLGHTYDKSSKSVTETTEDTAPFVGLAAVGKSLRNNKMIYRAIFLCKVQVASPSDEYQTKTDTTSFSHSEFSGAAYALADTAHTIRKKAEFETLTEAKAWILTQFGVDAIADNAEATFA